MRITKSNQKKNEKKNFKKVLQRVKRKIKGITLIALVVTIIILLILAGVALSLTVGDNGLFRRAENAAATWQMAEQNEHSEMDKAGDFIEIYQRGVNTATTVKDAIDQDGFYLENTKIKDDLDNEVVIPAYFKLASDSATKVEDGIVIEDLEGNQFVWIPAKTEDKGGATIKLSAEGTATIIYQRIDWGLQTGSYSDYLEELPDDEKASINKYGGYYIGRYEAGDKESTVEKIMRNENSSETNTITIKKGQVPYNWITYKNAKILAEGMNEKQGYATTFTKLISSYAWDVAINFIQVKNDNYGTEPEVGNYRDIEFSYEDLNGNVQTKVYWTNPLLVPTGQTSEVSKIYDMGGNLYEYTSERNLSNEFPYVIRGGHYGCASYEVPTVNRSNALTKLNYYGFRVTMYIK